MDEDEDEKPKKKKSVNKASKTKPTKVKAEPVDNASPNKRKKKQDDEQEVWKWLVNQFYCLAVNSSRFCMNKNSRTGSLNFKLCITSATYQIMPKMSHRWRCHSTM